MTSPPATRTITAPNITLTERQCSCGWWTAFPLMRTPTGYACASCLPTLSASTLRTITPAR